jgi:uncharacterized protein DUF6790
MGTERICRMIEAARWIGVAAGFALAYGHGAGPAERLHLLAPWLVGSLAGLTGIESVFLGEAAARLTGYAPSAYQRQSGMNNLALAATALLAHALDWGAAADVAVVSALLVFLSLSAANHLWSAWRERNLRLRSVARPAATAGLAAATLPLLVPLLVAAAGALGR